MWRSGNAKRCEAPFTPAAPPGPRNGSERGRRTICKHRLDRGDLQLRRSRRLNRFKDVLITIQKQQLTEGRTHLTDDERAVLHEFAAPEAPFSLMFRELLSSD